MKFVVADSTHHQILKPLFWQQWELELHQDGGTYETFNIENDKTVTLYVLLHDTDSSIVGAVALTKCDIPAKAQYTPWMSYVFVMPQYRGQGVVHTLINYVKSLQPCLYLFCRPYLIDLYQKAGFNIVDSVVMDNVTMSIMKWVK